MEDFEAKGQTGHLQSWTEREANITAKVAWIVETTRLLNSNESLGKTLLVNRKIVDHEMTPTTTKFIILPSILYFS